MTRREHAVDQQGQPLETDFGAFYPTGHIVIAFEQYEKANRVCEELKSEGFKEQDCELHRSEEVADTARRNLENTGLMARVGKSVAAIKEHLHAAENGATFLLVHAPNDRDTERVLQAISGKQVVLAHRYHHLAIEELRHDESDTHMTSPR